MNDEGFDLNMITHREIFQTKLRTMGDYWLLDLMPENFILISQDDASRLGLKKMIRKRSSQRQIPKAYEI